LKDRPTRLFFELECVCGAIEATVNTVVDLLQDYVYGSPLFSTYTYLSPIGETSFCRLIFPQVVFRSIDDDMKNFVLGFVKWLVERKHGAGLVYVKKNENGFAEHCMVINTAVYSTHQNIAVYGYNRKIEEVEWNNRGEWRNVNDTLIQPWFLVGEKDFCAQHIERIVYKRGQEDYSRPEIERKKNDLDECMESETDADVLDITERFPSLNIND